MSRRPSPARMCCCITPSTRAWSSRSTAPKIKSVRALPVGAGGKTLGGIDAYALEITLTDGKRKVFFVNYSGGKNTVGTVTTGANVAAWTIGPDGKPGRLQRKM